MRRSLMLTVATTVVIVLLAMLVPMGFLLRSYALEDRLTRAALEVQATETIVSAQDKGAVAAHLDRINRDDVLQTTVYYPDGIAVGPGPRADDRVFDTRETGRARIDDVPGGAVMLVPVSLGGSSALAQETPVIRVEVSVPRWDAGVLDAILVLAGLGVALLAGALLIADRLGRSFVRPVGELAAYAQALGERTTAAPITPKGPLEVRNLAGSMNRMVSRIEELLAREREGVSELSARLRTPITALRLRVEGLADDRERRVLTGDLDRLQTMVDHVVRQAREGGHEALVPSSDAVEVLGERARYYQPLAEEQQRDFVLVLPREPIAVAASAQDLHELADLLLENVFAHTPPGSPVAFTVRSRPAGGLVLTVDDGGPGLPGHLDGMEETPSGTAGGATGLRFAADLAHASHGGVRTGRSPFGGARVVVELGPPAVESRDPSRRV